MGKKKTGFRKSLGGYRKDDVNQYIADLAKDFSNERDEWETEKAKIQRVSEDEKAEKTLAETQRDELACLLYAAESNLAAQKAAAEEAEKVNMELKATIAGLSARIHEYEEEKKDADAHADDVQESVYQKINDKVEQIMTAANDSAREIVANALLRGDEVIAEAEEKAKKILREASAKSSANYYDDVMRFASEIRDSMNKLMSEIEVKKAEMSGKLDEIRPTAHKTEPRPQKTARQTSMDEKIETFFKNTLDAIANMAKRK